LIELWSHFCTVSLRGQPQENERLLDSTQEVAREWEKRLYALPDRNNDGRISRPE
jgi:hypothetical protein